jgi:hypothetical protein
MTLPRPGPPPAAAAIAHGAEGAVLFACPPPPPCTRASRAFNFIIPRGLAVRDHGWRRRRQLPLSCLSSAPRSRTAPEAPSASPVLRLLPLSTPHASSPVSHCAYSPRSVRSPPLHAILHGAEGAGTPLPLSPSSTSAWLVFISVVPHVLITLAGTGVGSCTAPIAPPLPLSVSSLYARLARLHLRLSSTLSLHVAHAFQSVSLYARLHALSHAGERLFTEPKLPTRLSFTDLMPSAIFFDAPVAWLHYVQYAICYISHMVADTFRDRARR